MRRYRDQGSQFKYTMLCSKAIIGLITAFLILKSEHVFSESSLLNDIQLRGNIRCGVNAEFKGFSVSNSLGEYSGFDVDYCRAVSSAVFDSPNNVEFVALTEAQRFEALKFGYIDILARNTTWTMQRNVLNGAFVGISFLDGQGFIVSKLSGIRSALEFNKVKVCLIKGTRADIKVKEFFRKNKLRFKAVFAHSNAEMRKAYERGACDVISTDISRLAAIRASLPQPDAHILLPEVISKEPLGPVVRGDDAQWENIARWSLNCLVNAEELGVTSQNIDSEQLRNSQAIDSLLGISDNLGKLLGVERSWCRNIIRHVGNYAEIYERNLGKSTPINLRRGVNELWINGGLLFAPPIR